MEFGKENYFSIEIIDLFWMKEMDSKIDLCLHGQIRVKIGDEIVVDIDDSSDWTVSASALHLLRTLEEDHNQKNPVGDFLIPCCGFSFFIDNTSNKAYLSGCPRGIDWEVSHEKDLNSVKLTTKNGTIVSLKFENYKNQILPMVNKIIQFYLDSPEKEISEEDKEGYLLFWKEVNHSFNKWSQIE